MDIPGPIVLDSPHANNPIITSHTGQAMATPHHHTRSPRPPPRKALKPSGNPSIDLLFDPVLHRKGCTIARSSGKQFDSPCAAPAGKLTAHPLFYSSPVGRLIAFATIRRTMASYLSADPGCQRVPACRCVAIRPWLPGMVLSRCKHPEPV